MHSLTLSGDVFLFKYKIVKQLLFLKLTNVFSNRTEFSSCVSYKVTYVSECSQRGAYCLLTDILLPTKLQCSTSAGAKKCKQTQKLPAFDMSAAPKFLENSGKYKAEKDGFDDGSGAGRR